MANGKKLAILHTEHEKTSPSDIKAINKFIHAGKKRGAAVQIINKKDLSRLKDFDALFIRDTTAVDNYTFDFALQAERNQMKVIDDVSSILTCCDKVCLAEIFHMHNVPAPKSIIINRKNAAMPISLLGYPFVLKVPDSSFCQGVFRIDTPAEYFKKIDILLPLYGTLLVQEYIPTNFDWRIGVFRGEVLYACKYFMVPGHWQVMDWRYNRIGTGEAVKLSDVHEGLLTTALKAASYIGDSLYGVDLKIYKDKIYVIEVNDNPDINSGLEDKIIGDVLYDKIMDYFLS